MHKNLSGCQFGRLTVVRLLEQRSKEGRRLWECKCSCGNTTVVDTKSLATGATKSCGCFRREEHIKRFKTHGETKTKLYYRWNDMKSRCTDSNSVVYPDYGGRGITVCDEWMQSYESFRDWAINNGYQGSLTLDRIDVNGNYCPDNCRWVSMKVQSNNKRNNRTIVYLGESHTISEWSDITGINKGTLRYRLDAGWTAERALTTKPISGGRYGTK